MKKWGLLGLLSIFLLVTVLAGCSSGKADKAESSGHAATAADSSLASTSGGPAAKEQLSGVKASQDASQEKVGDAAAPKAGTANTSTGFTAGEGMDGLNRKLIYKANLTMKVKDYAAAQSDIRDLVTLAGGYIVQFSDSQSAHELGGQFVVKIPASGFSSFLKDLAKIDKDLKQTIQGQDVSEEYVDLQSRLKVKQVTEARYLEFMQKATKTEDLVSFTNQLAKIQEEIEQIKGRMRYIDQNVSFSTVEIRVYQPNAAKSSSEDKEPRTLLDKASAAMKGSFRVLTDIAQALIVIVAGALPVLVVAGVIGVPSWILYRRSKKAAEARAMESEQLRRENNRALQVKQQLPENDVQGTNTPSQNVETSEGGGPVSPHSPKDSSENP